MKYDYIFVCWQIFIVLGKAPQEKLHKSEKDKKLKECRGEKKGTREVVVSTV